MRITNCKLHLSSFIPAFALISAALAGGTAWASPGTATESRFSLVSQDDLKISGELKRKAAIGENNFTLRILDSAGLPVAGAKVVLTVAMTSMDMGVSHPKVVANADGTYSAKVNFSMSGPWRVSAHIELLGHKVLDKNFEFTPVGSEQSMDGMQMDEMSMGTSSMMGRLGPWGMQKEGSGTSLLPASSPMFMKMLPKSGRYELNAMGFITFDENQSGGKRGDHRFFSNSMLMLMARRETGGGILGLNLMGSLDPVFNGEFGYPDLFQTGETAHGQKLTDYQHPHDLIDEVTVSFSHPIGGGLNGFVYGGPAGEPALGGPTFMHRPSGMEIPEAPITHHWFDSTHISYGVFTLGVNNSKWQLEGSAFNGHEPDENRYDIDPIRIDSESTRLSYNPSSRLALNVSYGYLKSPESTEPGVAQRRSTAAVLWNSPLSHGNNFAATVAFGRNSIQGQNSDGLLAEGTLASRDTSIYGRWEHVEKDELVGVPAGNYMINKFVVGATRNFAQHCGFDFGLGAYAGFYVFPSSLDAYYGKSPVTLGVYVRIRPSKMSEKMN